MAFKDIHKLKKIAVVEKEVITIPHLVVGKDIFALSLWNSIKEKYGTDQVRLLLEDSILPGDLYPKGPSTIRGEANQKIFRTLHPQVEVKNSEWGALFYKDLTWKNFEGRSKSEALKYDEEFFTKPRFDVNYEQISPDFSSAKECLETINAEAYRVKLKAIRRSREREGFVVECINGTEFHCEHLYFGLSPYHYLGYYEEKSELGAPFIEFCESTKTPSALFIKFVFENCPLSDFKETLFIPLSYTHEWGHFVGEFKDVGQSQEIEFMHFLEDHLTSEEDVSRIIRLMKKGMEKIFKNFSSIKSREFIALEQELGCLKIDDSLYSQTLKGEKGEMKNLFFIGMNAPLEQEHCADIMCEYSTEAVTGFTRGLVADTIVRKNFN